MKVLTIDDVIGFCYTQLSCVCLILGEHSTQLVSIGYMWIIGLTFHLNTGPNFFY